jgi:hypothetical protein
MPIHAWAVVFALIALLLAIAAGFELDRLLTGITAIGAGLCMWWAFLFVLAATRDTHTGLLGIVLWLSAAFSHVAISVSTARIAGRST